MMCDGPVWRTEDRVRDRLSFLFFCAQLALVLSFRPCFRPFGSCRPPRYGLCTEPLFSLGLPGTRSTVSSTVRSLRMASRKLSLVGFLNQRPELPPLYSYICTCTYAMEANLPSSDPRQIPAQGKTMWWHLRDFYSCGSNFTKAIPEACKSPA